MYASRQIMGSRARWVLLYDLLFGVRCRHRQPGARSIYLDITTSCDLQAKTELEAKDAANRSLRVRLWVSRSTSFS